jgi:ribose 1,5-bisphosphate isomerase
VIPEEVLRVAGDIREMRVRGASRIARAAVEALLLAAEKYQGSDPGDFALYMRRVAEVLVSTRPTAVTLPNAVNYVVSALRGARGSVEELRGLVVERCRSFISYIDSALDRIAEIGSRVLSSGDVVLTHCNSLAAIKVIARAHERKGLSRVYATETRPRFQGLTTYRMLSQAGVEVVLIPDSAVRYVMREVDKVVVGADAIAANGAVVNKIGTSLIALAARERGVDFYVAAETYKFSPYTLIGELVEIEEREASEVVPADLLAKHPLLSVRNPAFDVTAPEYVTGIITELGVFPPAAAALVLREIYRSEPRAEAPALVCGVEEE